MRWRVDLAACRRPDQAPHRTTQPSGWCRSRDLPSRVGAASLRTLAMNVIESIAAYHPEMTTWRLDFHVDPEIGFEEFRLGRRQGAWCRVKATARRQLSGRPVTMP